MKKYFYMAVAAIAVLSSCSNDNEFEPNQSGKQGGLVFTATMEGSEGTRAIYNSDKKCAAWEAGDKISIDGKTYSAQTAGTTTTFKADDGGVTGETYNAYFPANLYNGGNPTLPAKVSETWVEGKFNMPMYATSETTSLTFKNLCGVLKITVKRTDLASVKSITVSSMNCATSGAFTVNADNAAKLTNPSNTANTVTVTYTTAVTTDDTGTDFYVAIPAQTYNELSIAVSDGTTTKVMITSTNKNIQIDRNKIYPIAFKSTLTTTGEADVSESAGIPGNKVKWVQLWWEGQTKWAVHNVGATSPTDYGGYYAWGGKQDKVDDHDEADADLFGPYDTATRLWGQNWRMPNKGTLQELLYMCNVKWIDGNNDKYNGTTVPGLLCTGKGAFASNSMFLPAAGFYGLGFLLHEGSYVCYWSSTRQDAFDSYCLYCVSNNLSVKYEDRGSGCSVRAVLKEENN